MKIKYWSGFSKRKNETKQPTLGTEVDVYLKEDTSILNPSFECVGVPESVNYIRVDDWGRYYFVRNVRRLGNDRILVDCEVDVLATYKSAIGSYSGYVEFSTSDGRKNIYDARNKPTGFMDVSATPLEFNSKYLNEEGCYIVGVLSDASNGEGGVVTYYAMTRNALRLMGLIIYDTAPDAAIENQWFRVQESLISIIWMPLDYSKLLPATEDDIHIGKTQLIIKGKKINNRIWNDTVGSTAVSYSNLSGGAGADMTYLELAPFTTGMLYLPFVGLVPLNVDECAYVKNISIDMSFDILTGDVVYKVRYGGAWSQTFNGSMATKMPISGASYDAIGVASGTLASIGGVAATFAAMIASGGSAIPLIGGLAGIIGGAASAVKSTQIQTMINGSNSSAIGAKIGLSPFVLIIQNRPTYHDVESVKAEQGLPCYETKTISSLSGFVKCSNASVSIPGLDEEKDVLNEYINGGFYYT